MIMVTFQFKQHLKAETISYLPVFNYPKRIIKTEAMKNVGITFTLFLLHFSHNYDH